MIEPEAKAEVKRDSGKLYLEALFREATNLADSLQTARSLCHPALGEDIGSAYQSARKTTAYLQRALKAMG